MADSNLPLSPDVVELVRARAAATHSDPGAVADEILRIALQAPRERDDAARRALNIKLKAAMTEIAEGQYISAEESLAAIGLRPDDDE